MSSSSYSPVLVGTEYAVSGSTPAEDVLRDAAGRAMALGAQESQVQPVEGDADLVVVGRGPTSLAGRMPGPVPATTTSRAECDVLIVSTTGRGAKSRQ